MKKKEETKVLFEGIRAGSRVMLGKAITLVESSLDADREQAKELISLCLSLKSNSKRIGISGIPGAGKSSLIEVLGTRLTGEGKKVAVLAIDPSSSISGGSILGDKTRMNALATNPLAFVRPSPSSGFAGGVARRTRESIFLCEAAGYDYIFVETVGVGQSEISAASMTDMFMLLLLARAGDELQGIKRGIMEMADAVVITKADGTNMKDATLAKSVFSNAISMFPTRHNMWKPQVQTCSAVSGEGISDLLTLSDTYFDFITNNNSITSTRNKQMIQWMHEILQEEIYRKFYRNQTVAEAISDYEVKIESGEMAVYKACEDLLKITN